MSYWQKCHLYVKKHADKAGSNIFYAMQQIDGEYLPQITGNENA